MAQLHLAAVVHFLVALFPCTTALRRQPPRISDAITQTKRGPVAFTELGPLRGANEVGYSVFRKVPYVEPPERFARAVPKRAWGPALLDATQFGPGCIGSHTGVPEDEDCLNLNIWLPSSGLRGMPVIVYFHGGMNQHGSGQEGLRQGDGIVQSAKYPTIFINFDFRMGIFGWIYGSPGSNITNNLGFYDQVEALRWVKRHIAAFGGDPGRVTLQGQSEGAGILMVHMTSPLSGGLFQSVVMNSPPADIWSRKVNMERTRFIAGRIGCKRRTESSMLQCLKKKQARKLWDADWVSEELSRAVGSPTWVSNFWGLVRFSFGKNLHSLPGYFGWHPVIDGEAVLGEPRELIQQGRWNKPRLLVTIAKNESWGIYPGAEAAISTIRLTLDTLLREGDLKRVQGAYQESLESSGIVDVPPVSLMHQMVTDKVWTCESRTLAAELTAAGGDVRLGMFWHSPKYDTVGTLTNGVCNNGAACHAADMLYILPQGHGQGIHGDGMNGEIAFSRWYSDAFLAFVHGESSVWAQYNTSTQPMTFCEAAGCRVVNGYRKEQCDVLDRSVGSNMPLWMQRRRK